jgi:hypothetical protein
MATRVALAALLLGLVVGQARAGIVGSQGLVDLGPTSSDTGDINTATTFSIGDLMSNSNQSGAFVGMSTQNFGAMSLDTTTASGFSFGNAVFGTFASTSIKQFSNDAGEAAYYIVGDYTPGSYVGGGATEPASVTITFDQNPAHTGAISDSASFSVPPSGQGQGQGQPSAPEPSSLALGLIGVGIVGLCRWAHRRRTRTKA